MAERPSHMCGLTHACTQRSAYCRRHLCSRRRWCCHALLLGGCPCCSVDLEGGSLGGLHIQKAVPVGESRRLRHGCSELCQEDLGHGVQTPKVDKPVDACSLSQLWKRGRLGTVNLRSGPLLPAVPCKSGPRLWALPPPDEAHLQLLLLKRRLECGRLGHPCQPVARGRRCCRR